MINNRRTKSNIVRLDPSLTEIFDKVPEERIKKGIDKAKDWKNKGRREVSKMVLNCPSWKKTYEELTSLPRKKNDK